jgi:Fe-S cluster biogenesis protein NfuA
MDNQNVQLKVINMEAALLHEKVSIALDQLRPYLKSDGGDMELIEITSDNIVKVKLLGACKTCNMSAMTLKAGLVEALKNTAPQIQGVEAVD